ncbi:MAG: Rrf2 family transcriptional regulator [Candidatus Omnitrophota bacterium]
MKLITRDADYAVRALCAIANHKEKIVSVEQLVRDLKMPRPFMRKILQRLNKKGLLCSYKGKGGGFSLARSAEKILLLNVIESFQGPVEIMDHLFKKRKCPNTKKCKLKIEMDELEQLVIGKLKSITIASLL